MNEFFDEMQQVSSIEKSRNLREKENGTCLYGGSSCYASFGMPRKSGRDGLVCELGNPIDKPNKWCWSCWIEYKIERLTEALKWCSKSADFHEGGRAHEGWKKVVQHHVGTGSFTQWSNSGSNVSPSEALFGFMSWLTGRDEAVTFSGHHNAGKAADLVDLFCKVNNFVEPRHNWTKHLKTPKERRPDSTETIEGDRPPSPWQPHLEEILSKLSGTLSHDNVAIAKQILKKMLDTMSHTREDKKPFKMEDKSQRRDNVVTSDMMGSSWYAEFLQK